MWTPTQRAARTGAALPPLQPLPAPAACPCTWCALAGSGGARALADRALDEALVLAQQALGTAPDGGAAPRVQGEVCSGRPFEALLNAARERGADLLVVARHSRTPGTLAVGSTAQKVVALAAGPVLVHVSPPAAGSAAGTP